ncbi:MAG: hypothetical protein HUU35_20100, partial [Armatimonadetes bacterium]|nr:hypothetical protein [Armatimonadota bacterium]
MTTPEMAITGIGVVSSIGLGYHEFAAAVTQGVTGLGPWSVDESILAAEILEWDVRPYLVAEKTYLDRCSEFALAAAKLCSDDAGLTALPVSEERAGLALGTAFGCLGTMESYRERVLKRGVRSATPVLFSHAFVNTPASLVAIDFRLRGYHATLTSGAGSGEAALAAAITALACGHSDLVFAGGVEALTPELVAVFGNAGLGDDPDAWDPYGEGGVALGEGAAMLLLEPLERALSRGAAIRAVVSLTDEPGQEDLWVSGANGGGRLADPRASLGSAPKGLYGE